MSSTPQAITGTLAISYNVSEVLAYGAVSSNQFPAANLFSSTQQYSTGAAAVASGINLHIEDVNTPITLAASASQTFTLSSLTDGLARNFSMAGGVRVLVIIVTVRTAGDFLTFTPGATHGWTGMLSGTTPSLKIFDLFAVGVAKTDAYAITASSNDQFTITNGGSHSITFQIGIAGCNS